VARTARQIAGVKIMRSRALKRSICTISIGRWRGSARSCQRKTVERPFAPRCLKDVVEERLFAHRRDLFTRLDLVFMDTTSLYFEGPVGRRLAATATTRIIDRTCDI
jgi:hypothetical protein